MTSGKAKVSITWVLPFALWASLGATDAGRPGESGTGAMWIAPELLAAPTRADACAQSTPLKRRELVFETLEPGELDAELPTLLADSRREVIDFDWNGATGELTFSATAPTNVFSDLAVSSLVSAADAPNCGSR